MKVKLLGAAQGVTGSCFIVEANSTRFAVDCGMHQGSAAQDKRNFSTDLYSAKDIDFVLLTHAHIDHSGLLPRLVKDGFDGPVYCTAPTEALLDLMLLDSAHIQEMEAEWASRKRIRQGGKPVEPLYTTEDAIKCTALLQPVEYDATLTPAPGINVCYRDAGHILGSSFLELEVTEPAGTTRVIFSGDLGRPNSLLVEDPDSPILHADYLFLESTYGDRDHKNEGATRQELCDAILASYKAGEKTVIPAFAVERTQEIVFMLYLLHKEGKLPKDMPIFVDSPLAVKATQVFRQFPMYLDKELAVYFERGEDPFNVPGLTYVSDAEHSRTINELEGPGIIISASGMCNAGRIKHHLRHNLYREGAQIVFTGYQGIGTPGRKIVDGAKSINILGDIVPIRATINTLGGFSAHAGQSQLLDWLSTFAHPKLQVILIHGEMKAQETLAELIQERFNLTPTIPAYLEELTLIPGETVVVKEPEASQMPSKVNWEFLLSETEKKVATLRGNMTVLTKREWPEQVDLRDQLLELNKQLMYILSQL